MKVPLLNSFSFSITQNITEFRKKSKFICDYNYIERQLCDLKIYLSTPPFNTIANRNNAILLIHNKDIAIDEFLETSITLLPINFKCQVCFVLRQI